MCGGSAEAVRRRLLLRLAIGDAQRLEAGGEQEELVEQLSVFRVAQEGAGDGLREHDARVVDLDVEVLGEQLDARLRRPAWRVAEWCTGGAERVRRSAERVLRARRGCGGYGWRGESAERAWRCRKAVARLARCRAVDLERARGPRLVRLVDCAVRGKQPQALSMPWRSQRRTGAGGSLRAGLAGGRRASGRRGVAWCSGVRGGVAVGWQRGCAHGCA